MTKTKEALEALDDIAATLSFFNADGSGIETIRAALTNAPEWQPIETAPVYGHEGAFLVTGGELEGEVTGFLNKCHAAKVYRQGESFAVCDTDIYSAWVNNPTHWMPLPQPPKSALGKGE